MTTLQREEKDELQTLPRFAIKKSLFAESILDLNELFLYKISR